MLIATQDRRIHSSGRPQARTERNFRIPKPSHVRSPIEVQPSMELVACGRFQRRQEVRNHRYRSRPYHLHYAVRIVFFASFLSYVDLLGTTYSASTLATGYGAYIAQPLLRNAVEPREARGEPLTEEEAHKLMEESLKVLFYRDARSLNKASPLPTFPPTLATFGR
jgi:hypothetical protein